MESEQLKVIRIWAGMVQADGKVVKEEAAAMKRLIDVAELGEGERELALRFLEQPVELDAAGLRAASGPARAGIYRAAAQLSAVDKDVALSEVAFLRRLRELLDLEDSVTQRIEAEVMVAFLGAKM